MQKKHQEVTILSNGHQLTVKKWVSNKIRFSAVIIQSSEWIWGAVIAVRRFSRQICVFLRLNTVILKFLDPTQPNSNQHVIMSDAAAPARHCKCRPKINVQYVRKRD